MINKPTRITPTSSTLLDVLITNRKESVLDIEVNPSIVADHEQISFCINIKKPKREQVIKTFRCLKNYSAEILCNLLLDQTFVLNTIFNTDDVNIQVGIFNNTFNNALDKCAPIVTREIKRPKAPWINDDLKLEMIERNEIQKRLKEDRFNEDLNSEYKQKKKQVSSRISTARASYFKDEIMKSNSRNDTWKIMKKIVPTKKQTKIEFDNPKDKADQFNNFFASVGKNTYKKTQDILNDHNIQHGRITQTLTSNGIQLFRPQPVTIETVILTMKSLNNSNAYGIDGIPTRFLKDSLVVISLYITIIINTSIVTGTYPSIWKCPLVDPHHKSGDIDDPSNFRPVSILPVLSKVLEKIVCNQLMEHLESAKLLSNSQHGFRKGLSTETALLKLTDEIYKNIDERKISLLILCDLSKAFDSVNHSELLEMCKEHYIDTFWFENYLRDRNQIVRLGDTKSIAKQVEFGVPQGSVLGPILFLIYVNDMAKHIKDCFLIQYADDTQVLLSDKMENMEAMIEKAELILLEIKKYFLRKGLLLNANKTQCMFVGCSQYISRIPEHIVIKCDGEEIKISQHVKNLGVYMDRYMTYGSHIDELSRKASGILMYLNRIKDYFDNETRALIVQSLVLSIINYCIKIWGKTSNFYLEKAQKLQNFAARVAVVGVKKHDHITPTLQRLKWMKIIDKCSYEVCIFVFRILQKEYPSWLYSFPNVYNYRDTSTRQDGDLYIDNYRTDLGSRTMMIRGPSLWNKLPRNIRECSNAKLFKNKLKYYFLNEGLR